MEPFGYYLSLGMAFFSVLLLSWAGYQGPSGEWVYGFLAVIWSLLMMARLISLTENDEETLPTGLADKILFSYRMRENERRASVLNRALDIPFFLFLIGCAAFLFWVSVHEFALQSRPEEVTMSFLTPLLQSEGLSLARIDFYKAGQSFMILLSLAMMAFVLRSYAAMEPAKTRSFLIVFTAYAVAGCLFFFGLGSDAPPLIQSMIDGIGAEGIAMLGLILCIPLAAVFCDRKMPLLLVICALFLGAILLMSVYLPVLPILPGFYALCAAGLFLAWGLSDVKTVRAI